MRYLTNLLQHAFPSDFIRVSEVFSSDEVYNIEPHYSLRVGDVCKEFTNFYEFEKFVLKLVEA